MTAFQFLSMAIVVLAAGVAAMAPPPSRGAAGAADTDSAPDRAKQPGDVRSLPHPGSSAARQARAGARNDAGPAGQRIIGHRKRIANDGTRWRQVRSASQDGIKGATSPGTGSGSGATNPGTGSGSGAGAAMPTGSSGTTTTCNGQAEPPLCRTLGDVAFCSRGDLKVVVDGASLLITDACPVFCNTCTPSTTPGTSAIARVTTTTAAATTTTIAPATTATTSSTTSTPAATTAAEAHDDAGPVLGTYRGDGEQRDANKVGVTGRDGWDGAHGSKGRGGDKGGWLPLCWRGARAT